jgi:hypothetical protein
VKSEPTPDWLKVTWYWVFQFQVTLDGADMVKVTDEEVPEGGTLPVPDQPVQMYLVPEGPAVGDVTDSEKSEPESNQPLTGKGESYAEDTVK